MQVPVSLTALLPDLSVVAHFLNADPFLRAVQAGIVVASSVLVFLVFFATRDILHRTRSLIFQLLCIALVAAFPIVGFLLYLLIRPRQTFEEQELMRQVKEIRGALEKRGQQLALVKDMAKQAVREKQPNSEKRRTKNETPSRTTERSAA